MKKIITLGAVIAILIINPIYSMDFSCSEPEADIGQQTSISYSDSDLIQSRVSRAIQPPIVNLNLSTGNLHPNSTIFGNISGKTGYSMAAGDINGDGIDDLVIGAPGAVVNGSTDVGQIFVFYGSFNGQNFNQILNITSSVNITINGSEAGDRAGSAVKVIDINGDGYRDIIIAAPGGDSLNNNRPSAGEVYVIFGSQFIPINIELNFTKNAEHQNITFYGNDSFDGFGTEIDGADITGSSSPFEDLIISAPYAAGPNNTKPNAGEVIIISGNTTFLSNYTIDTSTPGIAKAENYSTVIFGYDLDQNLGLEIAAGELNSDNRPDLLLNSYGLGPKGSGRTGCGEIYLLHGGDNWPTKIDLAQTNPNASIYGQSAGDYAGYSIAIANVNFDNHNDIILGAPYADGPDSERVDAGEVYIIYGNGSISGTIDLDPEQGIGPDVIIYGSGNGTNSDFLGHTVAAGDYDYDGVPDIFTGGINEPNTDTGISTGRVYLVSTYYPLPSEIDLRTNKTIELIFQGSDPNDSAGFDIITCNLDATEADDVVISAPYADGYSNNNLSSGEIYITYGQRTPHPDVRGPVIISTNPINNTMNIPVDEPIVLVFDEPVVTSTFKFSASPDPGNWQVLWNSTSEKVTLTHNDFDEAILYKIDILQANDSIGNTFNLSFWRTLYFFTGDFTPPSIVQTTPAADAVSVSPYVNITVTFSEEIVGSTFQFNVTPNPGGWSGPQWAPTADEVTLSHSIPFEEDTLHSVEIISAKDKYGNFISGSNKPLKWNFTTGKKDPILPWVEKVYPADKSTSVDVSTYFDIWFSESMNLTTIKSALTTNPSIQFEKYEWLDERNSVRLTPAWNLEADKTYTITLRSSATDINGNKLDGNENQIIDGSPTDDFVWSFTTGTEGDITPPYIIQTRPNSDQQSVLLNHIIEIRFNEIMNQSSVEQAFDISPSINGTFYWFYYYITFLPESDYDPRSNYTVTLSGSAKDRTGNSLDGNSDGKTNFDGSDSYSWKFVTASSEEKDEDLPRVVNTLPLPDAKDVIINTNIEIEFSENMSWAMTGDALGVTPSVTGSFRWDGKILIFDPFYNLELDFTYTVRISAFARDLSGKFLDGNADGTVEGSPYDDYIFTFTTGIISDSEPPYVIRTYPGNNAKDVSKNTKIEIQFNELMMKSTVEDALQISPYTPGNIKWIENTLIFEPGMVLDSSMQYNIVVKYSARDDAGNYLDGNGNGIAEKINSDDFEFSFTTSQVYDTTPPTVLSTNPQNGSTGVFIHTTILINFSEPMNKLYFNDAFRISPDVPGTIYKFNRTMEFVPLNQLSEEADYTVTIRYTAQDMAGNTLDGNGNGISENSESDNYIFTFKTGKKSVVISGPQLTGRTPEADAVNVKLLQPIILVFDKAMNTSVDRFIFNCTPDPKGWELSWSDDAKTATLTHNKFKKNTTYRITLIYLVDQNENTLTDVPIEWYFKTVLKEEKDEDGAGEYTIGSYKIDSEAMLKILLVIFIWVIVIVIIAAYTLIKLKKKEEEKKDEEVKEEEEELPPPPDDEVPIIEVEKEEESEE